MRAYPGSNYQFIRSHGWAGIGKFLIPYKKFPYSEFPSIGCCPFLNDEFGLRT
jgi:hypothetical protein